MGPAGKLQGVIHFPYLYGLTGVALASMKLLIIGEMTLIEDGRLEVIGAYSNIGGQLGGWQPNSLVTLDDGTYQAKGPLATEPRRLVGLSIANGGNSVPYGNLELYTSWA